MSKFCSTFAPADVRKISDPYSHNGSIILSVVVNMGHLCLSPSRLQTSGDRRQRVFFALCRFINYLILVFNTLGFALISM